MKYIKSFEELNISDEEFTNRNRYWKLRTDSPYYEIGLKKIGMTEDEQTNFIILRDRDFPHENYIYIELYWGECIGSNYYWGSNSEDFNTIYMGEIENEITSDELKDGYLKYNIKKFNI